MRSFFTVFYFLMMCTLVTSIQANIIHVPADTSTIQGGIYLAMNGDTVLVQPGTYVENINFKGKAITVTSHFYINGDSTHIDSTIIDGSQPSNPDSGSVVSFISGEDTTSILYGFTITGGSGTLSPPYNIRWGGGIACWFSGASIISNKIINNTVTDNSNSVLGGGLSAGYLGSTAYVILEENHIKNNEVNSTGSGSYGGGVTLACNGRLINNVISYNSCTSTAFEANGGGVKTTAESNISPPTVIIKGNEITYNFAEGKKVSYHHGAKGGGIVNHYCKLIIKNNDILYNQLNAIENGDAYGAGINMSQPNNGSLISCNTISYNTIADSVTNGGGGISLRFSNNVFVPIFNNIISENSAMNGGGIYLYNSKSEIINNTVTQNDASANGGGLFSTNSTPIVINTILWDNQAINGSGIYPMNLDSVYYSDIQGGYTGTGNIDVNPFFADDSFNLADSSLCIGAGIDSIEISGTYYYAPPFDFYGDPRPNPPTGCMPDIGAKESPLCEPIISGFSDDELAEIPKEFTLKQNYPNPFNPSTKIKYTLPKSEKVKIEVFNLLGQKIETLLDKQMTAGSHEIKFTVHDLPSGVYLYRIEAGNPSTGSGQGFHEVKKMILLK